MKDKTHKLTFGFRDDKKNVELTLPDEEPRPWDMTSKLDVMGKRHQKVDAVMKVTGKARYTHDMNLPGMLFGGFVRCPHAKAKIKSLNLDAVRAHKQVKAVLEMPQEIRYAGAPVAAVAAETRQGLAEAIALANVEYEILPHAARLHQAMAEDAPQVHGNRPNVRRGRARRGEEAANALLSGGKLKIVEVIARTQVQTHSCLETHGSLAHWEDDALKIWTSTQATFGVRNQLSRALGIDQSKITVFSEFMGGGFGSKFMAGYWSVAAAKLAKDAKRPVKLMLDRREEQTDTGNRPDSIQDMKMGVDDNGKIAAYSVENLGTPGISRRAGVTNPMIYDFPSEATAARSGEVATNAGGQQAFRAPGHPQGSFGVETVIDLAAEKAGIDPLKFRMDNDSHPVRRVQYVDGAKRIGWENRKKNGSQSGRFRVGYGGGALGRPWGPARRDPVPHLQRRFRPGPQRRSGPRRRNANGPGDRGGRRAGSAAARHHHLHRLHRRSHRAGIRWQPHRIVDRARDPAISVPRRQGAPHPRRRAPEVRGRRSRVQGRGRASRQGCEEDPRVQGRLPAHPPGRHHRGR